MKIIHRIYLSNAVNIGLIILVVALTLHSVTQVMTKFKFIEIADDINATFLEMRLEEKNLFLYHNESTLQQIKNKIEQSSQTLGQMQDDILKAVGEEKFEFLKRLLSNYQQCVFLLNDANISDKKIEDQVREAGKQLKSFSEDITSLERKQVSIIIKGMIRVMKRAFVAVVIFALIISYFTGQGLRNSLKRILSQSRSISKGNYQKIEGNAGSDELGSVIVAMNTMTDELQQRKQEILQSKRLASIGVLVAGVAHELNNPLNNISMIAQTYAEVYDTLGREQRLGFMTQIEEQIERLRATIKNLLDFSKPKTQNLKPMDINPVIQKSIDLVRNMLDVTGIKTHLDQASDLPEVYIDSHQIQQVLVNLITNAIQAMSPGGKLSIASRNVEPGHDIEISIQDSGKGIPKEFLDNIFDPFFSTKEDAGTGLGLWVSYGIIKNHQGNIRVKSIVGKGTIFTITLPVYQKKKRD